MGDASQIPADKKKRLEDLVFYAVDKASPFALAFDANTNTLDKIDKFKFSELAMTGQGIALMWLWINAHCQPDAKPVGANVAGKARTVADVHTAVLANATA
ncbi:hypothetical protein [Roseateles sp.]|uniref:hypothetical protein n=1 Tax=Roseateles sp. TaxID=1971397 RepID=UPI0039E7447F